jgi:transposase
MLKKIMYQKIQELKRLGLNKSQIARKLEINKKTVRKYYHMDEAKFIKYQKKLLNRNKAFEVFKEEILEIYANNDIRQLNKAAVYDYLEEKYGELPGKERSLRNYIKYLIQMNEITFNEKSRIYTKVPELPYGRQMQLDFGVFNQANNKRLYIFTALLSASRYKFVKFQETPFKTMDVILTLLDCFDYFGGVPEEIVIDQDKLMVVCENYGDIIYTKDFKYFIQEMGINMYVCRKADPESKGKVENLVKYVKYNFLNIRTFDSAENANKSVTDWLLRRANGKISQTTKKIPAAQIEKERLHLKSLRNSIFRKDTQKGREERVVNDNYISVGSSYYGLPAKYDNKKVEIYVTRDKIFVFDIISGQQIVNYDISLIPGKKIMCRDLKRESETVLKDLKNEAVEYFDLSNWKIFLTNNFKRFPRYNRDQCLEARKYFKDKEIDKTILDEALSFCIANDTYTISNLNDTYKYFNRANKKNEDGIEKTNELCNEYSLSLPRIDVKKRSVEDYKQAAKGAAE